MSVFTIVCLLLSVFSIFTVYGITSDFSSNTTTAGAAHVKLNEISTKNDGIQRTSKNVITFARIFIYYILHYNPKKSKKILKKTILSIRII